LIVHRSIVQTEAAKGDDLSYAPAAFLDPLHAAAMSCEKICLQRLARACERANRARIARISRE
jgi:hypothetical protein